MQTPHICFNYLFLYILLACHYSEWNSSPFWNIIGYIEDDSFQAISCNDTLNQTHNNKKTNSKKQTGL